MNTKNGRNKPAAHSDAAQAMGLAMFERLSEALNKTRLVAAQSHTRRTHTMLVERTASGQFFVYPATGTPADGVACNAVEEVPAILTSLYAKADDKEREHV